MKERKRNPVGRPSVMTDQVLAKLEHAYAIGCTDTEACSYANISKSALYRFLNDHPDVKERYIALKETPVLKARETVVRSIENGDDVSARWLLERKRRDEFGNKADVNINADGRLTIKDRSEALSGFLRRFIDEP